MKKELRQLVLGQMKALGSQKKTEMDAYLTERFLAHPSYHRARTVATYLSFSHEFQTQHLIEQAERDGKRIVIPKTYPKGKMVFVEYDASLLEKTAFGIWEPKAGVEVPSSQIDLIHVPGLVFNKEGYRIGYGGGYYDRYLSDFSGTSLSLLYPFQLQEFQPASHDLPVKELIVYDKTI